MNKLHTNWKEYSFKDFCDITSSKRIFYREYVKSGVPFYRSKEIIAKSSGKELNDCLYISKDRFEEIKNKYGIPINGDILITAVGTYGIPYLINEDGDFYFKDGNLIWLKNIKNTANNKFLFYWLKSEEAKNNIEKIIIGSVQKALTIDAMKNIKIKLPPLDEQKRIASILSSLDDKIELNNKTNRILEELAQTIFEEWFINFNFPNEDGKPYKKSGGEMIGSKLGKIPKGWKVGTIGDLISNLFNGDWGKDTNKEKYTEEVICVRGADIGDISKGFDGNPVRRFILEKNLKSKKLLAGDIVIECSGGSPTQSTGRCIFVTENLLSAYDKPLICTNFCKVIKIKEKEYRGYAYNLLWYLYNTRLFFLFENGTTGIKNLDVNNLFKRHMIAIPDINVSSEYNKIFLSLIDLMHANKKENEKLSGIRDSLLPKLMSGEIRV